MKGSHYNPEVSSSENSFFSISNILECCQIWGSTWLIQAGVAKRVTVYSLYILHGFQRTKIAWRVSTSLVVYLSAMLLISSSSPGGWLTCGKAFNCMAPASLADFTHQKCSRGSHATHPAFGSSGYAHTATGFVLIRRAARLQRLL